MKRIIILFLALLAVISMKCSYAQQPQRHSEGDNIIKVDAGQNFIIMLESNQTTGFRWELAEPLDKNILKLVNVEYIQSKTKLLGAGGKEKWTFRALGAGQITIVLKYIRPWEKNSSPAKEKIFTVTIKERPEIKK